MKAKRENKKMKWWQIVLIVFAVFTVIGLIGGKDNKSKDTSNNITVEVQKSDEPKNDETEEPKNDVPEGYKIQHGELLDATVNGKILVIKAKIKSSMTNKMTIEQNYYNVENLIRNQGCDSFDEIQYWAVADMADGSEAKVISFTLNKSTIEGVKNQNVLPPEFGDYVDDLFILPSLLQ